MKKLIESLSEMHFKIEVLKLNIKVQELTLKGWEYNNPLGLCKIKYMITLEEDKVRLKKLETSLKLIITELNKTI